MSSFMNHWPLVLAFGSFAWGSAWAEGPPKMAHSHKAGWGGTVVMSGDDHYEFLRDASANVEIHISDKFRDPVAVQDISELKVVLVRGTERTELAIVRDPKLACKITVTLPPKLADSAQLEIAGKRLRTPKGYIAGTSSPKIDVVRIPKAGAVQDPHAGHAM